MKPVQGQIFKILLDYFSSKDAAVGNRKLPSLRRTILNS